jgi:putative glutamine amidotransferase
MTAAPEAGANTGSREVVAGSDAKRPLIGVAAYRLDTSRVSGWPFGGFGVPAQYLDVLRRAGARTVMLAPGEPTPPDEQLEPLDGLLIVGGGDVEPARYGAVPRPEVLRLVDPERDAFELDLIRSADRLALPTLCICRGMQVLNVAFGGTLHQHIPDLAGLHGHEPAGHDRDHHHDVIAEPGSRVAAAAGASTIGRCWSGHHQAVDRIGDGIVVTAHSPDGLVEAIERQPRPDPDVTAAGSPWLVGVQWHPERTAADDAAQQGLFDALVAAAGVRG